MTETITVDGIPSANLGDELAWVTKQTTIAQVETKLLLHKFSQLPVFSNKQRLATGLRGIVSWQSLARAKVRGPGANAGQALVPVTLVESTDDLFRVVSTVLAEDLVLVRRQGKIDGLITLYDLTEFLAERAEPFFMIGEIDRRLRRVIKSHFTLDYFGDVAGNRRNLRSHDELGFGDYITALQSEDGWARLECSLDRAMIVEALEYVRSARNQIMHFRRGQDELDISKIRSTLHLVRDITANGGD